MNIKINKLSLALEILTVYLERETDFPINNEQSIYISRHNDLKGGASFIILEEFCAVREESTKPKWVLKALCKIIEVLLLVYDPLTSENLPGITL